MYNRNISIICAFVLTLNLLLPAGVWAGQIDIPLRTWVSRPLPAMGTGPYPIPYEGKHSRLLFDSKRSRMVLAGGDYEWDGSLGAPEGTLNGSSYVWAIDLSQGNTWTLISPWCNPPLQPARPDTVGWVYDSKRDRAVMMPGFYMGFQNIFAGCSHPEVNDAVIFDFTTNKWQPRDYAKPPDGWGGDLGSSYSTYDPTTDAVYRFRYSGRLEIFYLTSGTYEKLDLPDAYQGDYNRDMPAIDVAGKAIYITSRPLRSLLKYSIPDRRIVEAIPLPAQWQPPSGEFGGSDLETYMVFDPINRMILNPVTDGFGDGKSSNIIGLAIYHVDTKKWEWESVPSAVSGNALGFDEAHNVMMFMGRSPTDVFWLYRYGNGAGPPIDTTPPAPPSNLQVR